MLATFTGVAHATGNVSALRDGLMGLGQQCTMTHRTRRESRRDLMRGLNLVQRQRRTRATQMIQIEMQRAIGIRCAQDQYFVIDAETEIVVAEAMFEVIRQGL